MSSPTPSQAFLDPRPYVTDDLTSSPIETIGKVLLPALFAAHNLTIRVATRRPRPDNNQDFPLPGSVFVMLHAGGGQKINEGQFMQDLILSTYHDDEATCETQANILTGLAGNALGSYVILDTGDRWDINDSGVAQLPTRQTDPMVNLTRYRSMVTWTTTGKPIE